MKFHSCKLLLNLVCVCLVFFMSTAFARTYHIHVNNKSNHLGEILFITSVNSNLSTCANTKETNTTQSVNNDRQTELKFKYKQNPHQMTVCFSVFDPMGMDVEIYNPPVKLSNFDRVILIDRTYGFDHCIELNGLMLPDQGFCNPAT